MAARPARVVSTVVLGYTLALLPGLCSADDKTPAKDPATTTTPAKAPDFSKYANVADVVGEIVKADNSKLVLRVTWFEQQVQGGNNNFRRPNLSANHRNFHNPYAPNGNRPPHVTVKEHHHDYELEFVPESLVRSNLSALPAKYDDKGKRVAYTTQELTDLRAPAGAPQYAASTSDLVPGTIVEVYVVRDKSIAAAKATEDDLRVKYAIILGKDPNPPKDIASQANQKAPPPKKKN